MKENITRLEELKSFRNVIQAYLEGEVKKSKAHLEDMKI